MTAPPLVGCVVWSFNLSVTTCQIPPIWRSSLIIPKVLDSLILLIINKYHQPAPNQHGFRPNNSITSALLQLTTEIAMGFNQRKSTDRTICVAVDLSVAFDTVCHNNRLSKINRSQLPPATARWLSYYLRGIQANTCFRGVKSMSRKVNTGVLQGSKLSPSLFSFYIADMPRPTDRSSGSVMLII